MIKKSLILTPIFYLFALLQNSFFVHYNFFGATPNLVLILFVIVMYFENKPSNFQVIFLGFTAGIFLDIFSYALIGPSIVILILLGFLFKKVKSLLKSDEDAKPFAYFLPILVISMAMYSILMGLYLYIFDTNKLFLTFGWVTLFSAIYNIFLSSIIFYLFKSLTKPEVDNRQMKLFKK